MNKNKSKSNARLPYSKNPKYIKADEKYIPKSQVSLITDLP